MSTAERTVATRAVQQATTGRETDILDALGIRWRDGHPHIACPYPTHGGTGDWRWDGKAARARCTCTKGDSIFDVLMKVEGVEFGAAKIRVAEIIGRSDLIHERASGTIYQATDAASLLNPPHANRDDSLVRAYLAYRLGVVPEAVPLPATPIAGIKRLTYFDPPPSGSGKGKPKPVGDFPCAVFGTRAADGRRHAHRIYLAADGAGKAELGTTKEGRERDPKKSAKVTGNQSTAGCAVLWGSDEAPWVVAAEGIETAAAIAIAFAAEIESGEVQVAAAISAVGLEAFQPWPAAVRATVAADRDEASKIDGRPPSRRGEEAARAFGLRHHGALSIAIALPGSPGDAIDWLDVLRRDGPGAVRAGLLEAVPFVPRQDELEDRARQVSEAAALEEIASTYPLPSMDTLDLRYARTAAGKIKVHKVIGWQPNAETGGKDPILVPVATPVGVAARLRYADQADAYGLRLIVQDMSGRPRPIDVDRATLARMGAAEIRALLFGAGLRTEDDGEQIAVQCLKAADPEREITVLRRPGWHHVDGVDDPVFVTPGGEVIRAAPNCPLELSAAIRMPDSIAAAGTLKGWKLAAAAAASVENCPHWTIGIIAAFVGPILSLVGLDTAGINLSGVSTSGKSTAQKLTASAWSVPDICKPGLLQSARATDNAVESMASRSNGTVLCMDELAHVPGRITARMIYTIAGGVGKRRMTADAAVRPSYTWATFAVLSGEHSLEERIRADDGEWMTGMAVRIVDIDVTGVNRTVGRATLDAIGGINRNYGHSGPEFVRAMVTGGLHRQSAALREEVFRAARKLAGDGADGACLRAAVPFALLATAGGLAQDAGLLPSSLDPLAAIQWAWGRFMRSSDSLALDPVSQAWARLAQWIAERWGVSIRGIDGEAGYRELVAWFDETSVYLPRNRLTEATGGTLNEAAIAEALDRQGLLTRREDHKRPYIRYVPKVGKIQAYALSRARFGRRH